MTEAPAPPVCRALTHLRCLQHGLALCIRKEMGKVINRLLEKHLRGSCIEGSMSMNASHQSSL